MKCTNDELLAVFMAIVDATDSAKSAHVPREAILKKVGRELGDKTNPQKCLDKLVSKGYVRPHPTKGSMTYELTDCGWRIALLIPSGKKKPDLSIRCAQQLLSS